jgi:integrase
MPEGVWAEIVVWSGNTVLSRISLHSSRPCAEWSGVTQQPEIDSLPQEGRASADTSSIDATFETYKRELARLCGKDANAHKQATRLRTLFRERGWRDLRAIDTPDVSRVMREMHEAGRDAKTIETLIGMLASFFEWAKREGLAQVNPCDGVKRTRRKGRGPSKRRGVRALTDPEVAALIAAAEADEAREKPRTLKVRSHLYRVLRFTGARVGQLTEGSLRWRDIDLEARTITFDSDEAKNGRGNALPLHAEAAKAFEEWRARCEVASPDDPVWPWKLQDRIFDGDLKDAGIPKRGPTCGRPAGVSSLRRSFAYGLVRSGVDVNVARRLMQHQTLEMTLLIYDEVRNHDLERGLEKMFSPRISGSEQALRTGGDEKVKNSSLTPEGKPDSVSQPGLPTIESLPNLSPRSLEQRPQAWPFGRAEERWEIFGLDPDSLAASLGASDRRENRPSGSSASPLPMPRGGLEPPLAPASGGDVRILVAELLETAARLIRATGAAHGTRPVPSQSDVGRRPEPSGGH